VRTTCGTFLFDRRGRLLICHPTNADPNLWTIPKGLHETGENYLEAATRELREEANIDLLAMTDRVAGVYELPRVVYANRQKALQPFVVVTDATFDARSINLPECDEHRWVTLAEASSLLHESQVRSIRSVKRKLREHQAYRRSKAQ
jgi:8-oxo-dGTP pyrophosphatase MutT (NUDIX family)